MLGRWAVWLLSPGRHRLPRQVFINQYTGKVLGNLSVVRFTVVMKALHNASVLLDRSDLSRAEWSVSVVAAEADRNQIFCWFSAPLVRSSQLPWVLFLTFHVRFCRHRCVYGVGTMDGARDCCDDSKQTGAANRRFPAEDRGSAHLRRSGVFCRAEGIAWSIDTVGFHPS